MNVDTPSTFSVSVVNVLTPKTEPTPVLNSSSLIVAGDVQIGGGITFKGDVTVEIDIEVVGNINQNPSGIATFGALNFDVGVGNTLTVDYLTVNEDIQLNGAGIATLGGDVDFNTITVDQFAVIGAGNTNGISTFTQSLEVEKDLIVGGDITLADLDSGNITVGGTVTTNGLVFNVGVGTDLTLEDLSVTGNADINGAGIATLGGDVDFNTVDVDQFVLIGSGNTTGISTIYQSLDVEKDLKVGGDITLADLDSGNITVGGTVTTNGLVFNTGVGTEAIIGFASITDAQVAIATVGELSVAGFATFGGVNTTGFSTFYQNLEITGDLKVGGDIDLEDLLADGISIGGTTTTNNLVFNVGIGTSLTITGISSLGVITGIGSELQYLPAGSISTSVGITSATPPTERPTGEPVQAGDLWFDSLGLRQYTYYVGLNSLGVYEGNWIDSNPPPIQPNLQFSADYGTIGQIDIANDIFNIKGTSDQIVTNNAPAIVGSGSTITLGLSTNVSILGDFEAGGSVTGAAATFSGLGSFGSISAASAEIDSVTVGDITVGDITVGQVGIDTLSFNVGVGTTLTVQDLSVTGFASISGAGIATLGGNANFENLEVVGFTTLGFTTVKGDLYVSGDLFVGDDLTFDEATLRNITVTDVADINNLNFNVGVGTTLTIQTNVSVGTTLGVTGNAFLNSDATVGGKLDVVGISSLGGDTVVDGNLTSTGNINTPTGDISAFEGTVSARVVTSTESLNYKVALGDTITSLVQANFKEVGFTTATGNDLTIDTTLEVTGITSAVGDLQFTNARGYGLTVQRLTVPSDGFVDLPGIPVVGGGASFSQLTVTGLSTFTGFTTFVGDVLVSGAMTVSSLTADEINFSGGTGIGSDSIASENLSITGQTNLNDLNVGGASTFVGVGTFQNDLYVAEDLFVKRDLLVGGATTTGILTATDAFIENLVITGTLEGSSGDAIIIDGDGVISGIVTIGDNSITLDGRQGREYIELGTGSGNRISGVNTITGEGSSVSVDEGLFNNFISVSGVGSTSTFANDVQIGGDLNIDGTITLSGSGGGTGIGSDSITTDEITVGFITATNASVTGIITAQDFNSLSDRRVKENIRAIESPLEKVDQINGVHFDFVNSGRKSMGVIAQEVEKVFPELISGTYPISVNYNGLIGLLIESVKELKADNEEMRKRLDKLEG